MASLLRWLDPRSHRWRAVVAAGGLAGLLLAAVELFGEGQPATTDQVATVAALFVGLSSFR